MDSPHDDHDNQVEDNGAGHAQLDENWNFAELAQLDFSDLFDDSLGALINVQQVENPINAIPVDTAQENVENQAFSDADTPEPGGTVSRSDDEAAEAGEVEAGSDEHEQEPEEYSEAVNQEPVYVADALFLLGSAVPGLNLVQDQLAEGVIAQEQVHAVPADGQQVVPLPAAGIPVVVENPNSPNSEVCAICHGGTSPEDDLGPFHPACVNGHRFHYECIFYCVRTIDNCPYCRGEFTAHVNRLREAIKTTPNTPEEMTRLRTQLANKQRTILDLQREIDLAKKLLIDNIKSVRKDFLMNPESRDPIPVVDFSPMALPLDRFPAPWENSLKRRVELYDKMSVDKRQKMHDRAQALLDMQTPGPSGIRKNYFCPRQMCPYSKNPLPTSYVPTRALTDRGFVHENDGRYSFSTLSHMITHYLTVCRGVHGKLPRQRNETQRRRDAPVFRPNSRGPLHLCSHHHITGLCRGIEGDVTDAKYKANHPDIYDVDYNPWSLSSREINLHRFKLLTNKGKDMRKEPTNFGKIWWDVAPRKRDDIPEDEPDPAAEADAEHDSDDAE